MGWSVRLALIKGRPTDTQLTRWARLSLPRLTQSPNNVAVVAGQTLANPGLTAVWFESRPGPPIVPDRSPFSFAFVWRALGIDPVERARKRAAWKPMATERLAGALGETASFGEIVEAGVEVAFWRLELVRAGQRVELKN